ncbi:MULTISPECIES: AraC family transcriptional regulator [unclassified Variovorax]|uniref:helix-turn-helix transcriptional regulator n=1 Tax=unclassified Variovorax TaxID=663243 RepID=UPI0025766E6B|nr:MULTISPECIES: AraC family transcriptional regulator [unclassified Variovorax]MDM0090904.1 AraC family transcriptional regulator [Variovorax sp. J22G40]MDM0149094.1 AraC family transcriptional regulator [Variovorax sp. J2P1-31]
MSERAAASPLHFDTAALPQRDRFAFWAEELGAKVGYTDYDSPERQTFSQRLTIMEVAGLSLMRASGSAVDIHRRVPSGLKEADIYPLHLLLKIGGGATLCEQQRRSTILQPDECVLIDSDQALRLRSVERTDSWIIGLSRPLIERWLRPAGDLAALPLRSNAGWAGALSRYLQALQVDQVQDIHSPFEQELVAQHVMSMLSFALSETGAMPDLQSVAARDRALHGRMCGWIRENLADPALGAQKMADHFGVSLRHVHKVFAIAGRGTTFLAMVQRCRLEEATRLLRTADVSGLYMAQIGYRCGFSDPAHFGRVFRQRYGCSPQEFTRAESSARGGRPAPLPAAAQAAPR